MKIGIHPIRHLTLIFFITNLIINFCAPNIFLNSANAVRKGQLTQSGKYAIPVQSAKSWCSGVAISTRVVITAAHCTSANGVVYSDIKVGFAGSNQNDQSKRISVLEVITEPGFNNNDSGKVPKDDIAFLILSSDLPAVSITRIASESDISALRSKGEVLLLQGYGRLDEGTDNSTYATYPFNGYFSIDSTATFDSTLQSISSKTSSACNGDSGAPVVWENGNESILLGVNVGGGGKENNCRQISGDSSYKTEVQIPTRHSTILVNSIVKASPTVGTALKNAIEDKLKAEQEVSTLKSTVSNLQTQTNSLTSEIQQLKANFATTQSARDAVIAENVALKNEKDLMNTKINELSKTIEQLQVQVETLKKYATTSMVCVKGGITKKIVGINPKCPAGYKKK